MVAELIPLPHATDDGVSWRARIGVVVLQSDLTVEPELASLQVPGVGFYHARIPNDPEVTPETLTAMKDRLPDTAALLPAVFDFAAIGYACTSASTLIGEDVVAEAIHRTHPRVPVTNPVSAAIAAFTSLGATRVGIVTPYIEEVTLPVIRLFEAAGIDVPAFGSFLVSEDHVVARTTPESITQGISTVAAAATCDAFFVSCTSVPLYDHVESLEAELGRPVVSSNLALGWHLLRLAGVDDTIEGRGTLLRTGLAGES
ncbi:MAG: Asp/Glu racemase [Acidimicrobiales bacterium]|nr:Asp/Glu racemase [Acidimicrobiales bacterium]